MWRDQNIIISFIIIITDLLKSHLACLLILGIFTCPLPTLLQTGPKFFRKPTFCTSLISFKSCYLIISIIRYYQWHYDTLLQQERLAVVRAEIDKWSGVPAWKKQLIIEQEKKKKTEMV